MITVLNATATSGLFHPAHRQQHLSYTLHGHWVVGNHHVESLFESEDLLLNILHITAQRNHMSRLAAGASSYLSHTNKKLNLISL